MDWIKSYTSAVANELPAKDRQEVKEELTSNIWDMLPENPTEAEIQTLLNELGDPKQMAQQYRSQPNYLIGPAVYPDYLKVLKVILPVAASFGAILAIVVFVVEKGTGSLPGIFAEAVGEGLGGAISFAVTALVWTTIGFVIAERTGAFKEISKPWRVSDLIDENQATRISLADILVEGIMALLVLGAFIWAWFGGFDGLGLVHNGERIDFFAASFIKLALILCSLSIGVTLIELAIKLRYRRWSLPVCVATIISSLVASIVMIILTLQKPIFSSELLAMFKKQAAGQAQVTDFLQGFKDNALPPNVVTALIVIAVLISVVTISHTIYRGYQEKKA